MKDEHRDNDMRQRRRRVMAASLAALSGLCLGVAWWAAHRSVTAPPEPAAPPRAAQATPAAAPARAATTTASLDARSGAASRSTPSLATVTFDRASVCRGEPNLVRVDVHDEAKGARVFIDGQAGAFRVVNATLEGDSYTPSITLSTRDGGTRVEAPSFEVRPCKPLVSGRVDHAAVPNAADTYRFVVSLTRAPRVGFHPTAYRWTFSDGAEQTTSVPTIERGFGHRAQQGPVTDVLVRVDITEASGRKLSLHDTLSLQNDAWQQMQQGGGVQLLTDLTPRFAEEDAAGRVHQTAQIWHTYDRPVTVTAVTIEEVSGQTTRRRTVPAASVLRDTVIRPGETVEAKVSLEAAGLRVARYDLMGKTPDGRPASGGFSLMRPTERPTPQQHAAVDAETARRIKLAQKLLGKPYITDGDLDRLAAEGAFDRPAPRPKG